MKINNTKRAGFTLVEIMIVVAIIGLLAAIAIPNFVRARKTAQMNSCINNMRLIDAAAQQFLLDKPGQLPTGGAGGSAEPYIGRGENGTWPKCPTTGTDSYFMATFTPDGTAVTVTHCLNTSVEYPHVAPGGITL